MASTESLNATCGAYRSNRGPLWRQNLAVEFRSQVRTLIQDYGKSVHEFSTAIERLNYRIFAELIDVSDRMGTGNASSNSTRDRGI
jgi:hypothetical protein